MRDESYEAGYRAGHLQGWLDALAKLQASGQPSPAVTESLSSGAADPPLGEGVTAAAKQGAYAGAVRARRRQHLGGTGVAFGALIVAVAHRVGATEDSAAVSGRLVPDISGDTG
ncbi:hypothetical protein [Pseudarthrobacter raffinosi]|uniref:hypothetical protein n=1 Tax=Pseudarthrobacter raffinosi TaxID=2953651 RepID=UPI00208EA1ED|nr:hypothetical protein [Pseudarthrobacter sp. MDT3-9]MCO4250599.1 hypothetical protein [Pseudarthrobacter sp. MDT3-9]